MQIETPVKELERLRRLEKACHSLMLRLMTETPPVILRISEEYLSSMRENLGTQFPYATKKEWEARNINRRKDL